MAYAMLKRVQHDVEVTCAVISEKEKIMERHKFIILLASTVIAAFLGSFTASLIVNGDDHPCPCFFPNMIERPMKSHMPASLNSTFEQNERMIEAEDDAADKLDNEIENDMENVSVGHAPRHGGFFFMNTTGLITQETKDLYKIIVDLKPFNKDMGNVNVKVRGNMITISAKYKSNAKNQLSSSQFYQTLTMPMKINSSAIKKHKEGDSLVIVIPKAAVR